MQMRESAGCVVRVTRVLVLTIDPGIADILGVIVPRTFYTSKGPSEYRVIITLY